MSPDDTPPVLRCPADIEVTADPDEATTNVTWTAPVPVDNSGLLSVLTSDPAVTPGSKFPIGVTRVTYRAEDLSQNVAKCIFTITVVGELNSNLIMALTTALCIFYQIVLLGLIFVLENVSLRYVGCWMQKLRVH